MLKQLCNDLRAYFSAKNKLTPEEKALMERLSKKLFPILILTKDDLIQAGFDVRRITDEQIDQLAQAIAEDYCQSEVSAGENFWKELEDIAQSLDLPHNPPCPACSHLPSIIDIESGDLHCELCDQTWHEDLYVLVELPQDISHFEEKNIGYPSFHSENGSARYVSEYDFIAHFKEDPKPNSYFKPLRWPESQPYLFTDMTNEAVDTLNELINDEKGIIDFGPQAVWIALCNI